MTPQTYLCSLANNRIEIAFSVLSLGGWWGGWVKVGIKANSAQPTEFKLDWAWLSLAILFLHFISPFSLFECFVLLPPLFMPFIYPPTPLLVSPFGLPTPYFCVLINPPPPVLAFCLYPFDCSFNIIQSGRNEIPALGRYVGLCWDFFSILLLFQLFYQILMSVRSNTHT